MCSPLESSTDWITDPDMVDYESHLWDSFLYAAEDADFAGLAVTLRCPDIL